MIIIYLTFILSIHLAGQGQSDHHIFTQYSSINGVFPSDDGTIFIYGTGRRSRRSIFGEINPKGHILWERETKNLAGACPLKNGRLFFLDVFGHIWTTDGEGGDFQPLPEFASTQLEFVSLKSTQDYIIIADQIPSSSNSYHAISIFDRENGAFLFRKTSRQLITNYNFHYEQVGQSIIEFASLDYQNKLTTYHIQSETSTQVQANVSLICEDMAFENGRIWLCGEESGGAAIVSISPEGQNVKFYSVPIPSYFQDSREEWLKMDIQDGKIYLCGHSRLLGSFNPGSHVYYGLWDIEGEELIDSLISREVKNGFIAYDSKVHESKWYVAGADNNTDTGLYPPASLSIFPLNELTSTHSSIAQPIRAYPNPCSSSLRVKGEAHQFPLHLIDVQGKIYKEFVGPGAYSIDNLSRGLYILKNPLSNTSLRVVIQ